MISIELGMLLLLLIGWAETEAWCDGIGQYSSKACTSLKVNNKLVYPLKRAFVKYILFGHNN